ncbi:MAG: type IV secretory system conjugative DNA transfer family protein [Acidaminococcaceae bacterium]|nr:type IV secretory system conjugative DNA transfer family protein [Acidaminococcaceae bacterium]
MKQTDKIGTENTFMEADASFRIAMEKVKPGAASIAKQNSQFDSLILGDGVAGTYSMDPRVTPVNNNVMVIAGTGGGKTKSVVEANLLHAENQSMAVLLTKRRLLDQYRTHLRKRGYCVKVLNLVNPDESALGFDPMLHVKSDSDLALLGKSLMECTGDTSERDRYWQNSAASLFCAIAKLAIHKYGKGVRMKHVLYLLSHIDVDYREYYDEDEGRVVHVSDCCPKEDFEELRDEDPKMYSDWCQYKENAANTAASIRGVLLTAINTIMTEGICNLMAKEQQMDFRSLVNQKTVLFIVTSPVNPALHPFANLVFGSMFKELFEYAEELPTGRLPIPLTAICDDFATGGQIPNFQHHISIFREKGVAVMMLLQSLSQLAAMYGHNGAVTIRDNTDNIVYLGGNDLDTAEQIARRINKPVDEVLALPIGQEYLFRRGQKPMTLKRYQIFDDPLYRQEIAPLEMMVTR